jgi:hypothetical protein
MTSFRQREANRHNACKSTGPITEQGKRRSRCNAVRHGLTAETVIGALGGCGRLQSVRSGPSIASYRNLTSRFGDLRLSAAIKDSSSISDLS